MIPGGFFYVRFCCMRKHSNDLRSSAQDVNVKRCTHFAPTLHPPCEVGFYNPSCWIILFLFEIIVFKKEM